jgi:DNA adenine methylase
LRGIAVTAGLILEVMSETKQLVAPFPYFGGKRDIAAAVWERFGNVDNYVEPFCGSAAVLLARPTEPHIETVNDADGFIANFWRAVQSDPETVAGYADWPVNENDLHARHAWFVGQKDSMQARLEGDPEWFDAKVAGWWCWGTCCWIGSGFCSGNGPWQVQEIDGVRQLVHVGDAGRGIKRKLVHVGDAGRGINRKLVAITDDGIGVTRNSNGALEWILALSDRLRRVRVCCGDWSRVCGPSPTTKQGLTGVFLDPPYSAEAKRQSELYRTDCLKVAHDVREWCVANGGNPMLRIALCGYDGEHEMPGWSCLTWKAKGGFDGQRKDGSVNGNRLKERIWFSPYCLKPEQDLFTL